MLSFGKIYLVRHGSYNRSPQELTAEGRAESESAGRQLLSVGVEQGATLLSSSALRALQTSAIIESIIGMAVSRSSSKRINIIGNDPRGVESLDEMLEVALAEAGAETNGKSLIVVAHQPLLEIAAFGARVANGQVVEYQPQTWQNPEFNSWEQKRLGIQLGAVGLA